MRLAVFSPLPPVRSGIADYSVELLGQLGLRHDIDVFVASRDEVAAWPAGRAGFLVRSAHEFVWARERTPYDLVVYQMGNAWCHDHIWPYLFRWPGLVVLHDAHLHHARAWSLLRRGRQDAYRAELAFNHPELPPEAAEIAVSGYSGPIYYCWPMLRAVMASARAVAVHGDRLAASLAAAYPGTAVSAIPMGVADPGQPLEAARALRARLGCGPDTILCAAFGAVTPEKRIEPLLRALAVTRRYQPDVRLLLVGQAMPHFDAAGQARRLGLEGAVSVAGFVPDAELPACLAAADLVVSLRWPSARETSASWVRAIAAGRPTIVSDLADQADLPALDPRSWTIQHARAVEGLLEPVAVSVDLLDEGHSLTLALKRLTSDAALRARLGAAARAHWAAGHTVAHMAARYEAVCAEASLLPDPAPALPDHLRPDPSGFARGLVAGFPGVAIFDGSAGRDS